MTKREFTLQIAQNLDYGMLNYAARYADDVQEYDAFIQELIDQDNDPNSREGLKKCLGETMYNELQKLR